MFPPLLIRPYLDLYSPTADEQYAVNVVKLPGGLGIFTYMHFLALWSLDHKWSVIDVLERLCISSDESSWKRATELLMDVAGDGEDTDYEVPCLIVAAKDDLDSFPMAIQNSTRVSQDKGIEAPIPISSKLSDFNNIFRRIVNAAEHPHLSIPETKSGRSRKQ
ncbi:hypothetical protein ES319_D07G106800v1 [Gossypium barbadense]|uniref:Uncharacterized protein n=1 Tax=Gossypium barbadense TaxID=3634 RepID=A0A5J5QPM4_GOSBA|nr:hypothetical protein ES319_D07G106800v1 [Gossypium barbadense]